MLKNNVHISNTAGSLAHPQPAYRTHDPAKLLHIVRGILAALGVVFGLCVALQLVYPAGRSMPRANFGGFTVGYASNEQIISKLAGVNDKKFTARTDGHEYQQSLGDIGISLQTETIAKELADYPLVQRLVPFSILFYQPAVSNDHLAVRDEAKLHNFAVKIAQDNNRAPIEGSLAVKDGEVVVTRSIPGRDYRMEDIAAYFAAFSNESLADEADLPYSSVAAVNTFEHLESVADRARKTAAAKHTITFGANSYELDEDVLKSSFRFEADENKLIDLRFDAAALLPGLEPAADGVFLAPAASTAGHELDWNLTSEALAAALKEGKTTAPAAVKPLAATSSKLYPQTSKGLQQLIEDWKQAHASLQPAILFTEIGGAGRRAGIDADVSYFSASVYKVFPAWYVLDQIDKGKLDPNGIIAGGMNLSDCFHNMIIVSSSECSEAIVAKYGGWPVIDEFVAAHGISGITLSAGVTINANGMSQFLQKLDAGELLGPDRTAYLLNALKHQKYRTGIPAGSAGEVADKVGYQPKTYSWHDAALVYHPKGKYTLVVLTHQGASLPTLSTLARQISDTLDR